MKKYIASCFFCLLFILQVPAECRETPRRGLFVSVIQDPPVLSSRQAISELIDFTKKAHIHILFVQIYRANEAWFPSKTAGSGPYQECFKNVSEDPFSLLIREAHASGIEVHAWLNLLSLSQNEDARILKKYGTSILTRNLKPKRTLQDYKIDDQYFLEPGDWRVRKELSKMVEEVVRTYPDLDGVQFDYIRYPDKDPFYGYTKINIGRFKKATGRKATDETDQTWKNWRRDQVTGFLEFLVKKTRAIRPNIQISTTGCAPYSRAYHEAFQDWSSWLKRGLVDFVTVMSYPPSKEEFDRDITDAKNRTGDFRKVNIGVGAYKLVNSPETFKQQLKICEASNCGACVVLHYGSLLQNADLAKSLTGDGN